MCDTDRTETALAVLRYLTEHPRAHDTIEGIAEWWLLEQRIKCGVANVKEALAELIAQGLVLEKTGTDARPRFRVNRRKSRTIRSLLERQSY